MDCPRPCTVLLVDESPIVRERLVQLVETIPGIAIVGECGDADCAVASLLRLQPDVLLLDIRLPGGGTRVLKYAVRHNPSTRVIVQTNQAEAQTRRICLGLGAHHFFDKSTESGQLASLLAQVAQIRP